MFSHDFSPKPSILLICSKCSGRWKISANSLMYPLLINFNIVWIESPSISIPFLLTNLVNFLTFFAVQFGFVQCNVLVSLLGLILTSVLWPHTGHSVGISTSPTASFTAIHLGIILFALITDKVHSFPIPSLSISLKLHRDARDTVVPSIWTGSNTATGEIVDTAHDHSINLSRESTASSCHLKAYPALVAWWPVTLPPDAYSTSS